MGKCYYKFITRKSSFGYEIIDSQLGRMSHIMELMDIMIVQLSLRKEELLWNGGQRLWLNRDYCCNKFAIKLLRRHSSFALQRD